MKICIVTASDLSRNEAPAVNVLSLARALKKQGLEPRIFAPAPARSPAQAEDLAIEYARPAPAWIPRLLAFQLAAAARIKSLAREGTQALYIRHTTSMLLVVPAARLRGLPCLVRFHGLAGDERRGPGRKILSLAAERINARLADRIVCVSEGIARRLAELPGVDPAKVSTAPNAVDPEVFRPVERSETCRKLGLDPGRRRLLFCGSLNSWQGVDFAVRALGNLLEENADLSLHIVGDGPERAKIEALAGEPAARGKILLHGDVPHAAVPLWIGACDVCLLPKRPIQAEYAPLKLYEYMACAKPVIASRLPGLETVEREKCGLLFAHDRATELDRAARTLLDNPAEAQKMGREGRRAAVEKFSWESTAGTIARELASCAKPAPAVVQ